jgi:TP53 regulating kinase-like protein
VGTGEGDGDGRLHALMRRVGAAVGALHAVGVVHGDLTTSNLMLRPPPPPPQTPQMLQTMATDGEGDGMGVGEGEAADAADDELRGDVVLIDFGLATQSTQDEDRAVDLYVLERAFTSTHPQAEPLFRQVLSAYAAEFGAGKTVLRRLDEVRLRGRKRSMVG